MDFTINYADSLKINDIEMHLLGVKFEFRRNGLGRMLIESAIDDSKNKGYSKMILWTQTIMHAAHSLYKETGFIQKKEKNFSRNGRDFLVYERELNA